MSFFKLTLACVVLASGAWSAGLAHAQGFGTDTYAVSTGSSIDGNGQHHPQNICQTASGVCNTSANHGSASAITTLGFVSGSVAGDSTGPSGWGDGSVESRWFDTFTVISGTLPAGTPVTLEASIDLVATVVYPIASPSPHTEAQATMSYIGREGGSTLFTSTHTGSALSITGTFTEVVGQPFVVSTRFALNVATGFSIFPDAGSVDASARYTLQVLTDGASYVTASGTGYAAPVPEPSSYALLVAGLLVIGAIMRRRSGWVGFDQSSVRR